MQILKRTRAAAKLGQVSELGRASPPMLLRALDEIVTFRSTHTYTRTYTWPPLRRAPHCRDLSVPLDHRTGQFNVIQIKNRRVSNEGMHSWMLKIRRRLFVNCF